MKELNNISAFRILLITLLCCLLNNVYIYIIGFMYLLFYSYKNSLIYLILVILISLTNSYKIDFIPYGIVEKKINNYYIVDKFLYKEKIEGNVEIGDVIKTNTSKYIDDEINLKKNTKFNCDTYKIIFNLKLRKIIFEKTKQFDADALSALNKFIYNTNDYDDLKYNLGYGFAIYYLLKLIGKKHNKIGLFFTFLYILLFYFDIKFYILIIDLTLNKLDAIKRFYIKIALICILNIHLLKNNTILIPLLISLYYIINLEIDFKLYFSLLESFLFGYFDIFNVFFFKYIIYFQILLSIFSFILIILPFLEPVYLLLIEFYSFINSINIPIRGTLHISGLILYILVSLLNKSENKYFKYLCLIIIILSPFNNPFLHISYIDVGQGDAILIKLPLNNGNVLIDTGSKYNYHKLCKYLYSQGIYRINYVIISHNDSDHNGNLENLKNDFLINEIIDTPKDLVFNNLLLKNMNINEYDNDNDNSLVYWANINGLKFLFTGDISQKAEKQLLLNYPNINADILKVSHHGSNTASSDEFISNILPKISIISTSGMYGHPSQQTIKTLNEYMSDTYITKDDGNIEIYISRICKLLKTQNNEFAIIKSDDIHN